MGNGLLAYNKASTIKHKIKTQERSMAMPWTLVKLVDPILIKPYKALEKQCIETAKYTSENGYYSDRLLVDFDGKKISVIDSLLYLVIRVKEQDIPYKIAEQMSLTDIKGLSKVIEYTYRQEKRVVSQGRTYKKVERKTNLTLDIIAGIGDNADYSLIVDDIKASILTNVSLISQLIACGVVLASLTTHSIRTELSITPYAIHSLIVGYWASRNNSISTSLNGLMCRVGIKASKGPKIKSNITFEENVENMFISASALKAAKSYISGLEIDLDKKSIKGEILPLLYYMHIEQFVDAMKDQVKSDTYLEKSFENCKRELLKRIDEGDVIFRYLGKRNINKWVYASLTASVLMSNYLSSFNGLAAILYIIYMNDEKDIQLVSEQNIEYMRSLSSYIVAKNTYNGMLFSAAVSKGVLPKSVNSITRLTDECRDTKDKLEASTSELKEVKQQLRKLQKEYKQITSDRDSYKQQLNKLSEQYSGRVSKKDIDDAKLHIGMLQKELDKKQENIEVHYRESFRRDKEIERLKDELEQAQRDYEDICEQLDKANERVVKLAEGCTNRMSILPYVNALKSKRIAIVGGNKLATRAASLGLEFRHIKEHYNGVTRADVADLDLCIICTGYVGHTLMEAVASFCKSSNIKIMYHNKYGADNLIKAAFEQLYS